MPTTHRALIGGGLLRLLANSWMLLYKARRLCWMSDGRLDSALRRYLQDEQAQACAAADALAHRIVAAGVEIPADQTILVRSASLKPDGAAAWGREALMELASDHEVMVADIDTLLAMLPLASDVAAAALMADLQTKHRACAEGLRRVSTLLTGGDPCGSGRA